MHSHDPSGTMTVTVLVLAAARCAVAAVVVVVVVVGMVVAPRLACGIVSLSNHSLSKMSATSKHFKEAAESGGG